MDLSAQEEAKTSFTLSTFLFCSSPQRFGRYLRKLVRAIFFTQSSYSNTLTDTPRKNVLQAICPSLHPIKLTHKLTTTEEEIETQRS